MTISPLLVDIYAGDIGGKPDIGKLIAAGMPWCGLLIKATQGDYYSGGSWFQTYWPLTRELALNAGRYGNTHAANTAPGPFYRGCYHYFSMGVDAKKQADYFLSKVERAGGWDVGDLWPMVDVEGAGNSGDITAQQIVDAVSTWSSVISKATGRAPVLYGGQYLAEHGVTDHCGCQGLIVARYTEKLPAFVYQRIGWDVKDLWAWQYVGDGKGYLAGYPKVCPMGVTDISVLTIASGGQAAIDWTNAHLYAEDPTQ